MSIFMYFCGSLKAKTFSIMEWSNDILFAVILFTVIVWLIPIMLNYLDSKENFK